VAVGVPQAGQRGTLGEASWEVLGPVSAAALPPAEPAAPPPPASSGAENDASLVLRVTARGVRILLTGDAEPAAQAVLLHSGADLTADVLKVPHHGSARQEDAFLAATGARLALASAGADNDYGHPAPRTLARLEALGMTVLRTDTQGALAVTADEGRLGAVTQR